MISTSNVEIFAYHMTKNGGIADEWNIKVIRIHSTIGEIPYWKLISGIIIANSRWWWIPGVKYICITWACSINTVQNCVLINFQTFPCLPWHSSCSMVWRELPQNNLLVVTCKHRKMSFKPPTTNNFPGVLNRYSSAIVRGNHQWGWELVWESSTQFRAVDIYT